MRKQFAEQLHTLMSLDENIVLLTGDLGYGLWDRIKIDYPDRFFNTLSAEQLMMGLRLFRPFDLAQLPVAWNQAIDAEKLDILIQQGLIHQQGSCIDLTLPARLCLNEVLRYIAAPKP